MPAPNALMLSTIPAAAVFLPNPPIAQCTKQFSQYVPMSIALVLSTVVAPVVPQPVVPFAQPTLASLVAAQPAALSPAVFPQPVAAVSAQPIDLAADWDEKDAYMLVKQSSRPRFTEASGSKIQGFIADIELFLRLSSRLVNH